MPSKFERSAIAFTLFVLASCSKPVPPHHFEPTFAPPLKGNSITLRVAYAVNPRFERFSDRQIADAMEAFRIRSKELTNIDVHYRPVEVIDLAKLFAKIPPDVRQVFTLHSVDIRRPLSKDTELLLKASAEASLKSSNISAHSVYAFTKHDLYRIPQLIDFTHLAEILVEQEIRNLEPWIDIQAKDGKPVIDGSEYNDWALWTALGYTGVPYDVILTNQIIANISGDNLEPHSAIRGGMALGTTSYSQTTDLRAFIFATTFPLQNQSSHMVKLRGGESYSNDEAASLFGAYLTHELGHLLFRFGHPFGRTECYMNTAQMVRVREWVESLDPSRCPETLAGQMKRNAIHLDRLVFDEK